MRSFCCQLLESALDRRKSGRKVDNGVEQARSVNKSGDDMELYLDGIGILCRSE